MTANYVPTVENNGFYSPCETLDAALAQWSSRGRVIEALDAPRDVLVRFYVDNGFDPRGWYVSNAKRVNVRTKASKSKRTWMYNTMIFAKENEYRPEVK